MSRRSAIVATVFVVFLAVVASGCGDEKSNSSSRAAEQVINIAIRNEPSTLDPALISDIDAAAVSNNVFAGLTEVVGSDIETIPNLAEGLGDVSDDGTTVTYTLRSGLQWSDGTPLTADDVVYGVLRSLDPATGSTFSYQLHDIVGAADYNECAEDDCTELRDKVGVTAVDDTTVEFTLNNPVPWFDQIMALTVAFPQPQAAIDKHGEAWTEPGNIVSSGPFNLTAQQDNKSLTLEANDLYWGADDVTLEQANLEVIGQQSNAYRKFKNEDVDAGLMNAFPGTSDIDEAKTDERFHVVPILSNQYIYLNTEHPLLTDPLVRKAIALAIDRPRIVEEITKAGESPVSTVAPPGIPGFDVLSQGTQDTIMADEPPNTDAVKDMLAEAGWNDGDELSLYFTTEGSERSQLVGESVQADLEAVGITVKLVPQSSANTLYGIAEPPIDEEVAMIHLGWIADYADAHNFYTPFNCGSYLNAPQYCDEAFDEIVSEIGSTLDATARYEKSKEAEAMLVGPDGAFPVVPLYADSGLYMVQDSVKGYEVTPLGTVDLSSVEMVEA